MTDHAKDPKPILTDAQYELIKRLVTVFLPALGALYFGLAQIWGFPAGEEVVGSIALVTVFLGAVLKMGERSYDRLDTFDGTLLVEVAPDGTQTPHHWEFKQDLPELAKQNTIKLNVEQFSSQD